MDLLAGLDDLPRRGRLDVLCLRPIHHVLEYEALFRLTTALRERAPAVELHLHLHSALCDDGPFARLPAHRVERLTERGGRGALAAGLRQVVRGWEPGAAALVLAPPAGWRRVATRAEPPIHAMPFGFHSPGCESDDCAEAGKQFLAALHRETPLWRENEGAPPPLPRDVPGLRFLIHQARFHIGDVLWLTPLLRSLHALFSRPRVTLVGPPVAATVLAGNPYLDELLLYQPGTHEEEDRRRVLVALAGCSFDAALFAFARRSESRWLMEAMALAGVPRRINLEYHDPFLDSRRPWRPATHEGWLFWGTLPSPRLLLHALDPLRAAGAPELDASLELHVGGAARRQAEELLAALGLAGRPFAVLSPGGLSSARWPAASFARLALGLVRELGLAVLVEGSAGEAPLLREVAAATAAESGSVLVRQDPLDVFAALLARARLAVCNDSAPLHFAAALGVSALYFAQREKLTHSHPVSPSCWALYDGVENDLRHISVEQAMGAVREMARRGVIAAGGGP
ncbi:MAG TPA: glycosyltransferase family 9 protein [Thermoanaerobaculia bacterium]|nr:glycosyltransferase family 9 protein [Thermoanaerobaculia bacterium]